MNDAGVRVMMVKECVKKAQQATLENPWRMNCSCGYRRFAVWPLAPIELWRRWIVESEAPGAVYSPALVARVLFAATASRR